ncbi:MAG TPA: hypothetical protein VL359_15335, partial [bacterium]|nr:hypothetical protein [bacterium]
MRKMLQCSFPARRVRIKILTEPYGGEGNTGAIYKRGLDGVKTLSLGGRNPSPGAMGHKGQLLQPGGGLLW